MTRHRVIEDQAFDWLVRRDGGDWSAVAQTEFDAWLAESPAHKAAFWRAEHGWRQADRIRSLGHTDLATQPGTGPRHRWRPMAIAASIAALIAVGALSVAPRFLGGHEPELAQARYATPIGGRRLVALTDGSKIDLNTRTTVRVAVASGHRDVWLDSGEAFFDVAHRESEPFVVHAGQQTVTVLGTKFSVRRDRDRVTVSVLEGRVRVDDGKGSAARAAIITAGDTAVTRGSSTLIAPKSEERVERRLAWREGILSFDRTPLFDAAAEFNRYNDTQIRIDDPAVGTIPIGGSFKASNLDAFVRLLHDVYGLKVQQGDKRITISN
jgi:transmembrane sensor